MPLVAAMDQQRLTPLQAAAIEPVRPDGEEGLGSSPGIGIPSTRQAGRLAPRRVRHSRRRSTSHAVAEPKPASRQPPSSPPTMRQRTNRQSDAPRRRVSRCVAAATSGRLRRPTFTARPGPESSLDQHLRRAQTVSPDSGGSGFHAALGRRAGYDHAPQAGAVKGDADSLIRMPLGASCCSLRRRAACSGVRRSPQAATADRDGRSKAFIDSLTRPFSSVPAPWP